ncbi:hypothetical protein Tco_0037716 [Tanacetum coccineum]
MLAPSGRGLILYQAYGNLYAMTGNGYPRKGQKSKPKRQNRARERKDSEKSKRQSQEMETDEDDDPDDIAEIFKIEGNLFDFETPLNYRANNAGNTQDNKMEQHDPSICNIRRFKMMKYSLDADDEYVAIKECEHSDHSRTNVDACKAYPELFRIMDEGWLVTKG